MIDNAFLKEVVVSRSCVLFLPVGHREGGPEGQVLEREGGREPGRAESSRGEEETYGG